jgi:archaellum component FlaC
MRAIIQEEIRAAMKEGVADLKRDINKELKAFRVEIGTLTDSINFMNEVFETFKSDLGTCKTKIDSITKEKESLRSKLNAMTGRFNQLEQITRASNLEIQCVPERNAENLLNIIKQLGKTVSCPINESDIFYYSRVAKKNPESQRPRSILVKMNSSRSRDAFLAAAIKYNKNNPQARLNTVHLGFSGNRNAVYVVENLSPENKLLHAAARTRAKELNYKHVWVRGGHIYMRKTDTSEYILVRNTATLDNLP